MPIEAHRSQHIGWVRVAVLAGNDGIASKVSLILGLAGSDPIHEHILLTGIAVLVMIQ